MPILSIEKRWVENQLGLPNTATVSKVKKETILKGFKSYLDARTCLKALAGIHTSTVNLILWEKIKGEDVQLQEMQGTANTDPHAGEKKEVSKPAKLKLAKEPKKVKAQ